MEELILGMWICGFITGVCTAFVLLHRFTVWIDSFFYERRRKRDQENQHSGGSGSRD